MYILANLFVKYRLIIILLYIGELLTFLFLFLAFFIYFIRNMLVGFISNNLDIYLFTSIILVLPFIFFLNRIKRIFFTKFKYSLVQKYDVKILCLQVSTINPTFSSVASFLSGYKRYDTQPEDYERYSERYGLFRSDLKKKYLT